MSLRPDDRLSRGRSKSAAGDRSRSRSNVRAPEAPEAPRSYAYPPASSPMPGSFDNGVAQTTYEVRPTASNGFPPSRGATQPPYGQSSMSMPYPEDGFDMGDYKGLPPHERPGYDPRQQGYYPPPPHSKTGRDDDDLAYDSDSPKREQPSRHSSYTSNYRYTPAAATDRRTSPPAQFQYAQAPSKLSYTAKPARNTAQPPVNYSSAPYGQPPPLPYDYSRDSHGQHREQLPRTYSYDSNDRESLTYAHENNGRMPQSYLHDGNGREAQVVDITPGRPPLERHSSSSKSKRKSTLDSGYPSSLAAPHPSGLAPRMHSLSVSGNRPDVMGMGGGMPPPSPLLEAYHGTYQSISPMPLAIRPDDDFDDLDDLEPLEPAMSRSSARGSDRLSRDIAAKDKNEKRRVKLYDAEGDAKAIASALNHSKPEADSICDVLPGLSHDQIMELRKEYKKQVKVQGKGVNLSKHINMKLSGSMFGKAVYVTALGRWESEGYWANFWYQSHGSRRELLIESLMGRTNSEIRMIKEEFRDKRYSDSLTKCMEKELKMDKFRTAVMMVLEERRQEEQDSYPFEYVQRDVDTLYKSVRADKGGESAMLEIIIRRSDAHLREVLRAYEKIYGENFARAALRKSNNLVGEVIAHILNGVINRPARDALLLEHAIKDIAEKNKDDDLRYELLISRLVRIHWDRPHLQRVKKEYYEKYRLNLEDAIEEATRGDFREFMCELCDAKDRR